MTGSSTTYFRHGAIEVAPVLRDFIEKEALPGTGIEPSRFWAGSREGARRAGSQEPGAAGKRDALQAQIDAWHRAQGETVRCGEYKRFLGDIGYLVAPDLDFSIETGNVDDEIARLAGPQLVVPVTNARYALNAANARWGSLYDALYGTDAIPGRETAKSGYDPAREALWSSPGRASSWTTARRWTRITCRRRQLCDRGRKAWSAGSPARRPA